MSGGVLSGIRDNFKKSKKTAQPNTRLEKVEALQGRNLSSTVLTKGMDSDVGSAVRKSQLGRG